MRMKATSPDDWALIQNHLGTTYADLSTGNRFQNLKRAIRHYQAALRGYTEADYPEKWANTQYNLGMAWLLCRRETNAVVEESTIRACFEAAERGFLAVGMTNNAADAASQYQALEAEGNAHPRSDM